MNGPMDEDSELKTGSPRSLIKPSRVDIELQASLEDTTTGKKESTRESSERAASIQSKLCLSPPTSRSLSGEEINLPMRMEIPLRNPYNAGNMGRPPRAPTEALKSPRKTDPGTLFFENSPQSLSKERHTLDCSPLPLRRAKSKRPSEVIANRFDMDQLFSEIVNPIEAEAETAILKALETREKASSFPSPMAVLPCLSDEAVENFQRHSTENQDAEDGNRRNGKHRESSFISLKSRGSAANSEIPQTKEISEHQNRNDVSEETFEKTLFMLTNKMRNIQEKEETNQASTTENVPTPVAISGTKNQFDSLAEDAMLLFRGPKQAAEVSPPQLNVAGIETDPKKNDDVFRIAEADDITDIEGGNKPNRDDAPDSKAGSSVTQGLISKTFRVAKEDLEYLDNFIIEKKKSTIAYAKSVFMFLILPATLASTILFYALGNPKMKTGMDPLTNTYPSISWFLIFLCVRQVITFSLAKLIELVLIDFLALKTRLLLRVTGPLVSLLIVQSKGWPCTLFFWCVNDLIFLAGESPFVNHWMYYQDTIGLFNARNPSGGITTSIWNFRILVVGICVGIVVAIKRFAVGMYLGGKQYSTYGAKLAAIMEKMITIGEVAKYGKLLQRKELRIQNKKPLSEKESSWNFPNFEDTFRDEEVEDLNETMSLENKIDPYRSSITSSERIKVLKLLDDWEEPEEERNVGNVSLTGILRFKQSLAFMDESYPFSTAFGLADNRENCVQAAEDLYRNFLRTNGESDKLHFETLVEAVRNPITKEINEKEIKDLVKLFRPERDGTLDLIGFVRSVDQVYKDLRLLRASIRNSSQIDSAFEAIINIGFYFLIFCVVLASWGMDPLQLFLSLSSVILAFSFVIGSASAKYFEGVMFILGRNPYDVGDRISINGPNDLPLPDGVATWYVQEVTLYYTTVRLGATNEVATISNSSLASCRIVNAARSKKAVVHVRVKFSLEVPFSKIQVFKETIEAFVKARPREWLSCSSIRMSSVEGNLGYFEYVISLNHRDSWQQVGNILESKAAVINYCLEVQRQLDIKYVAPATCVDLNMKNIDAFRQSAFFSDDARVGDVDERNA